LRDFANRLVRRGRNRADRSDRLHWFDRGRGLLALLTAAAIEARSTATRATQIPRASLRRPTVQSGVRLNGFGLRCGAMRLPLVLVWRTPSPATLAITCRPRWAHFTSDAAHKTLPTDFGKDSAKPNSSNSGRWRTSEAVGRDALTSIRRPHDGRGAKN